jgi:thiamine pyrophosphokinase
MKPDAEPRLVFSRRSRGRKAATRAAVIALEGSRAADVRGSLAWARRFAADPLVIAVDGGLSACRALGRPPDLLVGDLDSVRARPRGIPSVIYPTAKDFSDFSGALTELEGRHVDVVVVAGLLGGRLDHEWANLLEAAAAAPEFSGLIAPSSRGLVVVTSFGVRAHGAKLRLVSLFALGGDAVVSLSGARWTLKRRRVPAGSLGLSNEAGDGLALDVHRGVAALVFPRAGAS